MAFFPVSGSILSAPHLVTFVQSRYNRSINTTCSLLKAGVNHSYLKIKRCLATPFYELSISTRRRGIVHRDIWYANMHFDNNGDITIFDSDFCGNGGYSWTYSATGMKIGVIHS